MSSASGLVGAANLKVAGAVFGVLVASLVGAFAFGAIGAPSVVGVDNRFGEVTEETTIIHTDLTINNPNPIGIQLGGTTINYTVRMNDVPMAHGGRKGLSIPTGNSSEAFTTAMDNQQIPPWWASHINNGEETAVTINATVETSLLGERQFDLTQERTVETDIIGQFNSDERRPVNADNPPPTASNPILYIDSTRADWGRATTQETPIDMQFEVFNPQLEPYVITEVGYEITMNGLNVGEGRTEQTYLIPGGGTETLQTQLAIRNPALDEWWVSHLQNGQVTDLRIEFHALVELPTGNTIRVPLDRLTYEQTIETDIFGTEERANGTDGSTPTPTSGDGSAPTPTPAGDDTGGDTTPTPDGSSTPTPDRDTPTPTDSLL